MVGIVSAGNSRVGLAGYSGRDPRGGKRALDQLPLVAGADHGELRGDHEPGIGHRNLGKPSGRAVALCVSAYVGFSIGWILLVFLLAVPGLTNDHLVVPMVMGSPLYGTIFATVAVAPEELDLPGGEYAVGFGALVWIVIDGAVASFFFLATLVTFDHCLGRIPEVVRRDSLLRRASRVEKPEALP